MEPGELWDSEPRGLTTQALGTGVQGAQGRMSPCPTPLALEITTRLVTLADSFCGVALLGLGSEWEVRMRKEGCEQPFQKAGLGGRGAAVALAGKGSHSERGWREEGERGLAEADFWFEGKDSCGGG